MKHNLKTYFAASALLLCGALTGCTSDDDFGRYPEGSIPLSVGNVGVAGVETATRAATTENASGFTGIRKTKFVNGDALALTLSNDGGTTTTGVTATLTGGAWVLNPAKNFVIPGTTTIKAAYTPAAATGMKADLLEATTYTMDGQKVTFAMKHVHAMIDITYTAGVAPTRITVTAHNGTADENLSTVLEEEADASKHFRTIASPGTVKSLTAVINGQNYVATLATPFTVEANKRYPIALTFKENLLTATVGTATLNWSTGGAGELLPSGYDRYISTPEDLAQFAHDVNNNLNGARAAKVLQMADIDLAQLKTAAAANTANPGKNYTYTATAENWVPIADCNNGDADAFSFTGTYNGNGHTVSNMKITTNSHYGGGFFSSVYNATLTGIHLRDVLINFASGTHSDCASLCMYAEGNTTISLCSATGDITYYGYGNPDIASSGGLLGLVKNGTVVTRCSCNVNINANDADSYQNVGGFVGKVEGTPILAGCSYNGKITVSGRGAADDSFMVGGFVGHVADQSVIFGCSSSGTIVGSASAGVFGSGTTSGSGGMAITSCYSTMTTSNQSFGTGGIPCIDCAWTGTSTDAIAGVTYSVAVADLYDKITAYNERTADPVKTLHWSVADGYTITEATAQKWDAKGVWQDNGTAAPTVKMAYEGGNLTAPGAIVSGNTVWELNGYYLTAPDADAKKAYQWATDATATSMLNDPCAGHGTWRLPTMKDFEAMANTDWATAHPWSQDAGVDISGGSGLQNSPAFGENTGVSYWSSVVCTSPTTSTWTMYYGGAGGWGYEKLNKTSTAWVRCVQVK